MSSSTTLTTKLASSAGPWTEWSMGSLGSTYPGLTGKTKDDFGAGEAQYIPFMAVMAAVRVTRQSLLRVRVASGERQNAVRTGDLLFNTSSETPDELAMCTVAEDLPADTYLNSFCFGVRLGDDDTADPLFLAYLFTSGIGRQLMSTLAQGAIRYNLSRAQFRKVVVTLPPIDEQRAIAAALTAADELIMALRRLVAKEETIKQGMMQQLLTGEIRLPGFTRKWRPKSLADLLSYEQPGPFLVRTSTQLENGRIPVLTAGKTFLLGYTNESDGIYHGHPVVIFDDFTTASHFVDFDFKVKSSAIKILSAQPNVDLRFAYERMQLVNFPLGDHKRYWISEFSQRTIDVPELEEQEAIAKVLRNCTEGIRSLQLRLIKAEAIKQGMMQALLTGRTRLPVTEEVAA
jgi:type I restriction enzyme S subunit